MDAEHAHNPLAELSAARKIFLLLFFCFSQVLDVLNTSFLFSAIPAIATSTGLNNSQSVWLNSAYQLSFAALLLISGRMSDVYNPKIVFLSGVYLVGFFSLGIGFARNKIVILVLRALCGIGAALSIPSSLHLLIHTFPDPVIQAKAISAFAASGALANILGVIIGALIISYATWPWLFFMSAIIALLIGIACTFLIPRPDRPRHKQTALEQFQKLDISGSFLIITALVLFIFAVTSGATVGWKTATVLVPLFLSFIFFVLYFIWQTRVSVDHASLPPQLWRCLNFAPLVIISNLPYAWWGTVYLLFAWYWQEVESWSAINSGIHFLPIGVFAIPFMGLSGVLQQKFKAKHIILAGLSLMLAGTVFFPFANSTRRYWGFVFPGFMLGTAGTTIVYATSSIAVFATTPPEMAGTVGAVFNCGLQLGSAVFTSLATSLQTSVHSPPTSFNGRSAAFELLIGYLVLQMVSVAVLMRTTGTVSTPGDEALPSGPEGAAKQAKDAV